MIKIIEYSNFSASISSFNAGNYTLKLTLWDIFHEENPTELLIELERSNYFPPEFVSELPPTTKLQVCEESVINLPEIVDIDGDFSFIRIKPDR